MTTAETAYLFRHALLRDAAYELQLPEGRARLHELAYSLIELAFGGPAPALPGIESEQRSLHPVDAVASELAQHAGRAIEGGLDMRMQRRHMLRRAAEFAAAAFRHAEASSLWLELAGDCPAPERGWALGRAGRHAFYAGRTDDAEAWTLDAMRHAREHNQPALEARCHSALGSILRQTKRGLETGEHYARALELVRMHGSRQQLAGDLGNYGIFLESQGDLARAEQAYLEALAIAREAGETRQLARLIGYLGDFYRDSGRMDEALLHLRESLRLAREADDQPQVALQCERLGVWHALRSELAEAERLLEEAMAMQRQIGDRRSLGMALGNLGNLYHDRGQLPEAEHTLQRALEIHIELGNVAFQPNTLASLGTVALARADYPAALRCYERAFNLLPFARSKTVQGAVSLGYAVCLAATGRAQDAAGHWASGASVLREIGNQAELDNRRTHMQAVCRGAGVPPIAEASA